MSRKAARMCFCRQGEELTPSVLPPSLLALKRSLDEPTPLITVAK